MIVEGDKGSLVLITSVGGAPLEERTDVPRAHAEALLDVTPGKVDFVRSHLTVGTRDIHINRFVTPGPLDIVSVDFESEEEARDFRPLSWFGPDVTADPVYHNRTIALEGLPSVPEVPISNAALNSLLDTLENRYVPQRNFSQAATPRGQSEAPDARRSPPPSPSPAAEKAQRKQAAPQPRPEPAESDLVDDDNSDLNLNIEDNVIRELARSLRPQRR